MITMKEYANRRKLLMRRMGAKGSAMLSAAPETIRNGDTHYPYRQQSDFYYLTGFEEPEAAFILSPQQKNKYVLFNRERHPAHEQWDGPRAGQAGACKEYGADQAYPIGHLKKILPQYMPNKKKAVDIAPLVHEMRLIKSPTEIKLMQKAADISKAAHIKAMQVCRPGMYEYELDATITMVFKQHGALHCAYPSIVASGKNACILHYVKNNQKMRNGELVLIDAGCEYQNYASDITRTFPVNGRFSSEQRAVYEIVLAAQLAGIRAVKPGASWNAAQEAVVEVITQGLLELGILKGRVSHLIEEKAYFPFYMHRSGHWLGLDVHDVGEYKINSEWRKLKPGMVLTVEPGIYISENIAGVPKHFRNIGVRIEDDVLVTKQGRKVLSQRIPKTVADIEAVMAK